jgi:hypothetical protein
MNTVALSGNTKHEGINNYCPLRPTQTSPFNDFGRNLSLLFNESKWQEPNNMLRSHNNNDNNANIKTIN